MLCMVSAAFQGLANNAIINKEIREDVGLIAECIIFSSLFRFFKLGCVLTNAPQFLATVFSHNARLARALLSDLLAACLPQRWFA